MTVDTNYRPPSNTYTDIGAATGSVTGPAGTLGITSNQLAAGVIGVAGVTAGGALVDSAGRAFPRQQFSPAIGHLVHSGRVVADFSTLTGYVVNGSNTAELADLPAGGCGRIKDSPSKGIRVTCVNTGNVAITSPAFTAGNSNGNIQAWLYVEDFSKVSTVTLSFYTDWTLANYYVSSAFTLSKYNGWHLVSLSTGGLAVGGGSPTLDTITVARVRMDSAQAGASWIVDRVVFGAGGGGLVTLQWDDGQKSDYTLVAPLLAKYGLVGNFAIIAANGYLEQGSASRLTVAEAKILAESGHRLMTHGLTAMDTISYAAGIADIAANKAAIDAWGMDTDSDIYVYPGGKFLRADNDLSIPQYLQDAGFYGAFTTVGIPQGNNCKNTRYLLPRSEMGQSTTLGQSAANILTMVDERTASGKNVSLLAHNVVESGATGNQMNVAVLDEALAGLADRQKAGALRVVSAKELIRASLY